MQVASIPILSALTRSTLPAPSLTPRQKLPPPMTTPTSTPMSTHFFTASHTLPITPKSRPLCFSPASASPLIFSSTRLYTGLSITITSYMTHFNSFCPTLKGRTCKFLYPSYFTTSCDSL